MNAISLSSLDKTCFLYYDVPNVRDGSWKWRAGDERGGAGDEREELGMRVGAWNGEYGTRNGSGEWKMGIWSWG